MTLSPPAIEALGNSSGFSFRLQDKGQQGYAALAAARDQLLAAASKSPVLTSVYVEGLPTAPQIELTLDRQKANALPPEVLGLSDTGAIPGTSLLGEQESPPLPQAPTR